MEQNNKNDDCYFYNYSVCTKGDKCPFRHEVSALGCEVMCPHWQQGNCFNEKCSFRHMELKKNRKVIPCYWEKHGGCTKPHCPFLHSQTRRPRGEETPSNAPEMSGTPPTRVWSNRRDGAKFEGNAEAAQGRGNSPTNSLVGGSPTVDPIIVSFDEGTLSLPSTFQPNSNPRTSALSIRNRMTLDMEMPTRLALRNTTNVITSCVNVTPTSVPAVQAIQHQQHHQQELNAAVCHHTVRHPYSQSPFYTHVQTLQVHNQPTSIPRQSYPNDTQNPRTRAPYPFSVGFNSYRRYY